MTLTRRCNKAAPPRVMRAADSCIVRPMHPRKVIDAIASRIARHSGRTRYIPSLLLQGCLAATAWAQGTTDPMETCYRLTDPGVQLACFKQEMQRRHAVARGTGVTTVTHTPSDDTIGLDGKQLRIKRKEEGIQPPTVKPIVAALTQLRSRPGHQYFFELDNGQVWESTDAEPNLFPGPHETVTIRPGVFGAFFLKTQAGRSIRVHRLR